MEIRRPDKKTEQTPVKIKELVAIDFIILNFWYFLDFGMYYESDFKLIRIIVTSWKRLIGQFGGSL